MVNTEPLQHCSNNCFRQDSQRDAKISTESPKEEEDTYISKYSGEQPDAISLRVSDSLVSCISLCCQGTLGPFCGLFVSKIKRGKLRTILKFGRKIACILRKRCQASEMVVQKVGRLSHLNQREVAGVRSSEEGGRESRKEGGVVEC